MHPLRPTRRSRVLEAVRGERATPLTCSGGVLSGFFAENVGATPYCIVLPAGVPEIPFPPGAGQEPSSSTSTTAGAPRNKDGLDVFRVLGHRPLKFASVVICETCASYMQLPEGPCRQLASSCKGVSKVPSTRSNHLAFLRHAAKGLHPKTGCPLPLGSSLPSASPEPPDGDTQQVPPGADRVGAGSESSGVAAAGHSVELEDAPDPSQQTEADSISVLREVAVALRFSAPWLVPSRCLRSERPQSSDGGSSD